MNREGIRRLAAEELELPTSRYAFAATLNELKMAVDQGIGYPCVIKPLRSSSGKGQSLVKGPEALEAAWDKAQHGARARDPRVIAEEWIDFDEEITLLTVRHRGPDGIIETSFCEPIGHVQVDGDYVESWQPHDLSPAARRRSERIAATITSRLGGRGIFGVELFIKGDQVWFSEVSPRPHDTGMVTMISQAQSEFALHARAILGLPLSVAMRAPGASHVIYGGVDATGIAFEGLEEALAVPQSEVRLFGKPESFVKRRMGVALAAADDVTEARRRAKQAATAVRPVATE